jgi:HTH-type transcriptional regulator/antitoxin HipB
MESKSASLEVDAAAELENFALEHEAFREGRDERLAMIGLGKMLRQMREHEGITQEELARRTGMTQPAISRIEQGFSTHAPTIETLARYVHGCKKKLLIGAGAGGVEEDYNQLAEL